MRSAQYSYSSAEPSWAHSYLWPLIRNEAVRVRSSFIGSGAIRAFDLGCGSGATANLLAELGFDVTGIDTSESGIGLAASAYPSCKFELGSAYEDLAARYGQFHLVVSLEVIEHLFDPKALARAVHDLLAPHGVAIISTPYHSYLKNLAIAMAGKFDKHFTVLCVDGHIKFFSISTLGQLLTAAGFRDVRFARVGRIPPLAKSMVAIARKGTSL